MRTGITASSSRESPDRGRPRLPSTYCATCQPARARPPATSPTSSTSSSSSRTPYSRHLETQKPTVTTTHQGLESTWTSDSILKVLLSVATYSTTYWKNQEWCIKRREKETSTSSTSSSRVRRVPCYLVWGLPETATITTTPHKVNAHKKILQTTPKT